MKKIFSFLLIFLFCFHSAAAVSGVPEILSPSAILMDKSTGQILFEKDSHAKLPPASVTKVMTLLLVMEALDNDQIKLEDTVSVSEYAASMGGSQVFLSPGENMYINDLLKATVIASGNDSAVALAETVAGSESGFVELMNKRAKELGMNDTNFVNCTGLDAEGHITSAHDIAVMSKELLKHEKIKEYSTTWMDSLRNGAFTLANTNKLIRSYKGITGLKTGSTGNAKYCLSASAERDGLELIAAIMAAPSSKDRFADASKLLDFGFANYGIYDASKEIELSPVPVILGEFESVPVCFDSDCNILVEKSKLSSLSTKLELEENVNAPVEQGQTLGKLMIFTNDELINEVKIVAAESVKRLNFLGIFNLFTNSIFMR